MFVFMVGWLGDLEGWWLLFAGSWLLVGGLWIVGTGSGRGALFIWYGCDKVQVKSVAPKDFEVDGNEERMRQADVFG